VEWSQKQIDFFRAVRVDPIPDSDPRVDVRFDPSRDEPQVVTLDGPTLCKDQTFRNEVATAAREHTVFLSYVEGPLEDAISVCIRLGDSLGHQCVPPYGGPLTGEDAKFAVKVLAKMREDKTKE
jgi:hypothetical protein